MNNSTSTQQDTINSNKAGVYYTSNSRTAFKTSATATSIHNNSNSNIASKPRFITTAIPIHHPNLCSPHQQHHQHSNNNRRWQRDKTKTQQQHRHQYNNNKTVVHNNNNTRTTTIGVHSMNKTTPFALKLSLIFDRNNSLRNLSENECPINHFVRKKTTICI